MGGPKGWLHAPALARARRLTAILPLVCDGRVFSACNGRGGRTRLLVVEDEPDLVQALARGLRQQGYAVDVATYGEQGWELAEVNDYFEELASRVRALLRRDLMGATSGKSLVGPAFRALTK